MTVPATTDDGQTGVQPSRIIGVEGPRWMLRATLLGEAALDPDEHALMGALATSSSYAARSRASSASHSC